MSIFTRLLQGTKSNRAQALTQTTYDTMQSPMYTTYKSYLECIKLPFVKACVGVIAYNAANVAFHLVKGETRDGDEPAIVDTSPLLFLMQHPNLYQTGFDLREQLFMDLELTGNCFISMEGLNGRSQPSELYRLNPAQVTIVAGQVDPVDHYVYTANAKKVVYGPDEMLHFKTPNPMGDGLYGLGVIEAGEDRFTSDKAMGQHEANFWQNGAKITGVLTTDGQVDNSMFAALRDSVRRFFRGSGYSTLILENGLKYTPVSGGPAQLGLLEMAKHSRDTILAMFGVPPTKLGIMGYAEYKDVEADKFFWTETIDPKLTRFEQQIQRLVDLFHPGEDLHIVFDRLNFSDDKPTAEVARLMFDTHSYTLNEIRAYQSQPALDGFDVVIVPPGFGPLDTDLFNAVSRGMMGNVPVAKPAPMAVDDTGAPMQATEGAVQ